VDHGVRAEGVAVDVAVGQRLDIVTVLPQEGPDEGEVLRRVDEGAAGVLADSPVPLKV